MGALLLKRFFVFVGKFVFVALALTSRFGTIAARPRGAEAAGPAAEFMMHGHVNHDRTVVRAQAHRPGAGVRARMAGMFGAAMMRAVLAVAFVFVVCFVAAMALMMAPFRVFTMPTTGVMFAMLSTFAAGVMFAMLPMLITGMMFALFAVLSTFAAGMVLVMFPTFAAGMVFAIIIIVVVVFLFFVPATSVIVAHGK